MKNLNLRVVLSAICLVSIFAGFTRVEAGPVGFDQIIQSLDVRPGRADSSSFARLSIAGTPGVMAIDDDGDDDKKKKTPQQDGRVITETRTEIVDDDQCDCVEDVETRRGFPKWALLGLAAIPVAFIIIKRKKDTPTPTPPGPPMTPTVTPTSTPPGMTPTPTPPGMTPTPTPPGMTPTPTPIMTPTPPVTPTPTPPEPIPEPLTILLFGTGLASVGLAARRKFGKRDEDEEEGNE